MDDKKHMKIFLTSLVIRKMQIKTIMKYHSIPSRMAKIKMTNNINRKARLWGNSNSFFFFLHIVFLNLIFIFFLYFASGNAKCYSHFGKELEVSYKVEYTLTKLNIHRLNNCFPNVPTS